MFSNWELGIGNWKLPIANSQLLMGPWQKKKKETKGIILFFPSSLEPLPSNFNIHSLNPRSSKSVAELPSTFVNSVTLIRCRTSNPLQTLQQPLKSRFSQIRIF